MGIGLQNKNLDELSAEFSMPSNQILAKFQDTIKKLTKNVMQIMENSIEADMPEEKVLTSSLKEYRPLEQTLDEELGEDVKVDSLF